MEIDINDLAKVQGIGPKTLERVRESISSSNDEANRFSPSAYIGVNSLNLGNCFNLMAGIPNNYIDMVLADLPYGTTACSWDSPINLNLLWDSYSRVVKDDTAIVLTASQPFTSTLVMSNVYSFKHEWIWEKNRGSNFGSVKYQPMKEHESVLVFSYGVPKYYPIKEERKGQGLDRVQYDFNGSNTGKREAYGGFVDSRTGYREEELRYPSSIQKFNTLVGLHPTQKPVELFEYLIETYTDEGDVVLDNTAGVYTTAIACINTNRKYICIEQEEEYHNKGKKWVDLVKSGMDYREAMNLAKKEFEE